MTESRTERAERLGPFFGLQLTFAARIAELTGSALGEAVRTHTYIHRRLGLGVPSQVPVSDAWRAYAAAIESTDDPAEREAITRTAYAAASDEIHPLPGQAGFGCFAHEPPKADGAVKIHFYNRDTDEAGGPLSRAKLDRRRADLAALTRSVAERHPEATRIVGRSWLYNLDAYRRLFPADYAASRRPATPPLHLSGTSVWGQAIDSRENLRPEVRAALLAALPALDPSAPWLSFPLQVFEVDAPVASFRAAFGV